MFRGGVKVRCVDSDAAEKLLTRGAVYTVENILSGWVFLEDVGGGWSPRRFEKVENSTRGMKHDGDKIRTDLLPVTALMAASEVFTFGAKKYGDRNWEYGIKNSRLYGACLRHLFAHIDGETLDPESNQPHISHALCCVMMLSDNLIKRPDMDDRWENKHEA